MRILEIRNTMYRIFENPFAPEKKFLPEDLLKNTRSLLKEMSKATIYKENKNHKTWTAEIITRLNMGKKVSFCDRRIYNNKTDCTIKIGRSKLDINSSTGEIVTYKKGFKTWKKLFNQAENAIYSFIYNFNNESVVTKNSFQIAIFTKKGYEEYKKANSRYIGA